MFIGKPSRHVPCADVSYFKGKGFWALANDGQRTRGKRSWSNMWSNIFVIFLLDQVHLKHWRKNDCMNVHATDVSLLSAPWFGGWNSLRTRWKSDPKYIKRDWKISLSRWLLVYLSIDNTLYTGSQSLKMYVMVLLLFFIYLVPVVFVFCIVLKLGLWLAINLIQLAVWLLKHAFVLLWKLLVFVAVLVFASLRSSPPPK